MNISELTGQSVRITKMPEKSILTSPDVNRKESSLSHIQLIALYQQTYSDNSCTFLTVLEDIRRFLNNGRRF